MALRDPWVVAFRGDFTLNPIGRNDGCYICAHNSNRRISGQWRRGSLSQRISKDLKGGQTIVCRGNGRRIETFNPDRPFFHGLKNRIANNWTLQRAGESIGARGFFVTLGRTDLPHVVTRRLTFTSNRGAPTPQPGRESPCDTAPVHISSRTTGSLHVARLLGACDVSVELRQ